MESIEDDNKWVDMIIDKIGFALTKVDKSIQKGIEFWSELTKDIYDDDQLKHDTTGQPNNGKSGEEDSFQDKSVAEVKERPIQHWAMCLRKANNIPNQHRDMCIGEPKESPSQHWAKCASKIPESLIREQRDEDYYENDCDDGFYYNEEEEEDETTVSESSQDMWEINLRTSTTSYRPNCNRHHKEEASGSSLKWNDGYELELLKNGYTDAETIVDKFWYDYDDDVTPVSKSCENMWPYYVAPIRFLRNENDLSKNGNRWDCDDDEEEEETRVSESCGETSELYLKTSARSYIPCQYQHHRNEKDDGSSLRGRSGYEMLKNDDTCSEEDGDSSWSVNEGDVKVWIGKHVMMSDGSNVSLVGDDDEDEDKLQGFVNVKKEEILNNSEFDEVETISPECDWVYVTRD